jgi:hypothetical protein
MENAVFGGESDSQFSEKERTDKSEFDTIKKAMCDFSIVVDSIHGSVSYG